MLNLFASWLSLAIMIGTGFFFTPYLLNRLGPEAYGMVPLVTMIVSYFSLLTQTAGSAISRHLTVAFNSDRPDQASKFFGSALYACAVLTLLLVVPLTFVSLYIDRLVSVPESLELRTQFLCATTSLGFLFTVLSTPFQAVLFSRNKIFINSFGTILQTVLRVGFVVFAFSAIAVDLAYLSIGILLGATASIVLCCVAVFYLIPDLKVGYTRPDWHFITDISGTAGGLILLQMGTVLLLSTDILLANRWFGTVESGYYAAAIQLAVLLRLVGMNTAVVFTPTILNLHARKDIPTLVSYTKQAMKYLGMAMAIPAGMVCGGAHEILTIWLGPNLAPMSMALLLLTAPVVINNAILPIFSISLAANKTGLPGILTLVLGVVHVGFAYILAVHLKLGVNGIALSLALIQTLKNLVFTPIYAAMNIDKPWHIFLPPLVLPTVLAIVVAIATHLVLAEVIVTSLVPLLALFCLVGSAAVLLAFALLTQKERRDLFVQLKLIRA